MAQMNTCARELMERIKYRSCLVGVVGLGYVGLPLVRAFHDRGFSILGFDNDRAKIKMLSQGENYLGHLGSELAQDLAASPRFEATADADRLCEPDAVLLCVPTPLGAHREPDLSYVLDSTSLVASSLRAGQLIVLESTTYPGTTRQEVLPVLEKSGLTCGEDVFLAYSPEREDPGREDATTSSTPKLVGGVDAVSCDLAGTLYEQVIDQVHRVSSAEVAEAAKLLENIYRAVNIALVNEMKMLFTDMDIDIWEVIAAASTKPFGFQPFYPGPGLGGHCIPIDPFYLTWKAKEYGNSTRFIELAGEINTFMPEFVVSRTIAALNEESKAMKGSKILVLGVAYKPNVSDARESPSATVIELLQDHGATVTYHDPHVASFPRMRKHDIHMESLELTPESLAEHDAVVVLTDHDQIDWRLVARHAPLIVDSRNRLKPAEVAGTLVKA